MQGKSFYLGFIALLFISNSHIYSDDCAIRNINNARKMFYNNNNTIFIAEQIKKIDGQSYEFKVLDILKGEIDTLTKVVFSDYVNNSVAGDKWLIYGNKESSNIVKVGKCSISRSYRNPVCLVLYNNPPKYNFGETKLVSLYNIILQKDYENKALVELIEEIFLLKEKRNNEVANAKSTLYFILIVSFILVLIVINILLFLYIKRIKRIVYD